MALRTCIASALLAVSPFVIGLGCHDSSDAPAAEDAASDAPAGDGASDAPACSVPPSVFPKLAKNAAPPCDVVKQDCHGECADKCTVVMSNAPSTATNTVTVACLPTLERYGEDHLCTYHQGIIGYDDCAPGFVCSAVGRPANAPDVRTCHRLCTTNADCSTGSFCRALIGFGEAGIANVGACVAACDPFDATSCAPGDSCLPYVDVDQTWHLACGGNSGAVAVGGKCNVRVIDETQCSPGALCAWPTGSMTYSCLPFCDDAHPCGGGAKCDAPAGYQGPTTIRVCSP
jgi:hypothetical protein